MMGGLFACAHFSTQNAADYLCQVLQAFKDGTPLLRAAGQSLPALDLPLFEDCFGSLGSAKSVQPSQWRDKFKTHSQLECYLNKRQTTGILLDPEQLRQKLTRLREDETATKLPDAVVDAFEAYIEAPGTRSSATEALLYQHDWSKVRNCFDRQAKTSSRVFAERTRDALLLSGVTPTPDDEAILKALEQISRKSGEAEDEFRDFYHQHLEAIERDPKLFIEWEDFVHGRRITCSDLFQGIMECIQRTLRVRSPGAEAYLVIQGDKQSKPNSFEGANQRACEFFQRHYGKLPEWTNKKIRFNQTLLPDYSTKVRPLLDRHNKKKSRSSGGKSAFTFHVHVFEKAPGSGRHIATLAMIWTFPKDSVLALEGADLDALCRYVNQPAKTASAECVAEYEVVGKKGRPLSLALDAIEGFADSPGASGRGSFVPAQSKIHSLAKDFTGILDKAQTQQWFPTAMIAELNGAFAAFDSCYSQSVATLRADALDTTGVEEMLQAYTKVLAIIATVPHEDGRRQLLRGILRIGIAHVRQSGHRPRLAIICPWHPLRMEAIAARTRQILGVFQQLLGKHRPPFSDGPNGALFFRETEQLLSHPLYPDLALTWNNREAIPCVATQFLGGYTLHEPADVPSAGPALEDSSAEAAKTLEHEMLEYLRLQPHERDNLSVLLYNCESPTLPSELVNTLNKLNKEKGANKITCQILLMHSDESRLRHLYRDLVAAGVSGDEDTMDMSGDFLARVRVNITAASKLKAQARCQPVDIAYCRDLLFQEAAFTWEWTARQELSPDDLQPHQWSRHRPFGEGERTLRLMLVCPAQTPAGWHHLYSIASLCAPGADNAWEHGQCPVPMRSLSFDNQRVDRIFRETHELANWVINQDELLDRRILEQKDVKVIRYVQSTTHGRNLIISSKARDTLLVNTLKERLAAILPSDTPATTIEALVSKFQNIANAISGGLILKAARRANNTSELFGMALSRYIIESELGPGRPVAWCFLDDYSQWLGKKEGANIADLLVLAPVSKPDGTKHLDIIVTEAKFVTYENLGPSATTSSKQLADTLSQISEALLPNETAIDQQLWLARLSDMLIARANSGSNAGFNAEEWRALIRQRACTFRVWGYSHVFVHSPLDIPSPVSTVKGVATKGTAKLDGLQEIFGPEHTRQLILQLNAADYEATKKLRATNGHPGFNRAAVRALTNRATQNAPGPADKKPNPPTDEAEGGQAVAPPGPSPRTNPPSTMLAHANPTNSSSAKDAETKPGQPALLAFLHERSSQFTTAAAEGNQWLLDTTAKLRNALLSRGLSARLAENSKPILTPNAAIIKLQGSKDMTVQAVETRAEEIFTSDGLQIINATPESGRVSIALARPSREILHTETVMLDFLRRYRPEQQGERLLVGIREEDGQPMLLDPLKQPHTLVAGMTGSGKSVLMQNLILSIAATRTPEEAQIFLIDPKFGVDYRPLDLLPHIEAGSKTIIDNPESALEVLEGLVEEMNNRYQLFKEAKVKDCKSYRQATSKPLPTLWVIHDEFADWMQTEDYAKAVPDIVGRLSTKARAAGIFLIFAAQRPDNTVMPLQLRSQLGNRLILQVDNAATSEIAMGEKNAGAERLLGHGHMLAKTGETPQPIFVQVPYIDILGPVPRLVQLLRLHHGCPASPELP
jgi:S-DNA-T family DNA segregation ATPase FtsK/SpoIIIE